MRASDARQRDAASAREAPAERRAAPRQGAGKPPQAQEQGAFTQKQTGPDTDTAKPPAHERQEPRMGDLLRETLRRWLMEEE